MRNDNLEGLTLVTWAAEIWNKHRRGIKLIGHDAAVAYCMENHPEWRSQWDSLGTAPDEEVSSAVLHVHHDAMIKSQIDMNTPPEVKALYQQMRDKEFREFEAIHTLVVALSEQLWESRADNRPFDSARYVEKAAEYTKLALQRPTWVRRQQK